MHALKAIALSLGSVLALGSIGACKKKVTGQECDQLLDRFASLVVQERMPGAPPETIRAEQARERDEAKGDDNFKNCTSEVQAGEYACAMAAKTSDAFIKCLE